MSDDVDAEGAAAFAAALTERETTESACDQAERARVAGAVAAALARLAEAAGTGSSAATFALCVAVEHGAMATCGEDVVAPTRARLRAIASARDDAHRASKPSSAPPLVLESGARFAAERALVALDRSDDPTPPSEPSVLETFPRLGFGIGRGRALPAAPRAGPRARAQSRAETHAAAEAEAAGKRRGNASGNVEGSKKPPLRVVAAGSVAAVERGMRQGWVFRYVGSAVAPRDEAYWTR